MIEAGAFEHAQVLHRAEARHVELGVELGQRPSVALEQQVEQKAARRIGERFEDGIVGDHLPTICDLMVTCQAGPVRSGTLGKPVRILIMLALYATRRPRRVRADGPARDHPRVSRRR